MKLFRYFTVALNSILAHKMRAVLTMLGIIIGVAAVLTTMGFGSGASADITESITSGGINQLTVSAGSSNGSSSGSTLTMADADALAALADVAYSAPQYSGNATFTVSNVAGNGTGDSQEGSYSVIGTAAAYATVKDLDFELGTFLSEEQVAASESVVVLGYTVATDLFGSQNPLDQTVRIDNHLFRVVGVLEEAGGNGFGSSDTQTFVPIEVAQGRLFNVDRYRGSYGISTISMQIATSERIDAAELQTEQVLRMRHGLNADDENDFTVSNQADALEMVGEVTSILTYLLGGIGGISLLVGGIGIMNIMLVSVTERTREIGLRKAVGAHNNDILLQFLIEALLLCALGGLIGIGISYGLVFGLNQLSFMPFGVIIEPWALALALGVSTASGFIFGLYPAWRATQLDPIDALRFE